MMLYLIRHGEALPPGAEGDPGRPLTPAGERDVALIGRTLAALPVPVDLILTSPLVRAVQTGEIIRAALARAPEARTTQHLLPGFHYEQLFDEVCRAHGVVAAVGHQPDLSNFIAWLVAEESPVSISVPPAAIAAITYTPDPESPRASLRWLATPELLSAIAPQP